jgi:hypothetical protein
MDMASAMILEFAQISKGQLQGPYIWSPQKGRTLSWPVTVRRIVIKSLAGTMLAWKSIFVRLNLVVICAVAASTV